MKLPVKLIFVLLLLFNTVVLAKSADKDALLHIEADQVEMHERDNTSIYTGHVKITKGSLKITGSKIVIKSKNGELHLIKIKGKPATFFQLNDLNEEISAESYQMDYLANSGLLELKEKALLVKSQNRFSSQHIIYDTQQDIVKAGHSDAAPDPEQPPRVQITITPKKQAPQTSSQDDKAQ